jgi:hypothetical protein
MLIADRDGILVKRVIIKYDKFNTMFKGKFFHTYITSEIPKK